MVRIRLKRTGRRHRSSFRIAAVDIRSSRDGAVLEELGYYDPAHKNPDLQLNLKRDRIAHWLGVGAQPSDTVRDIIKKAGILQSAAKAK